MKVTVEKVERLVDRADVSYETARNALEAANGDLIDAIIALEQEGKLGPNAGRAKPASYTTGGAMPVAVIGQSYEPGGAVQTQVDPNFIAAGAAAAGGASAGKAGAKGRGGKKAAARSADPAPGSGNAPGSGTAGSGYGAYQGGAYQGGAYQGGPYQQGAYQGGTYQGGAYQGGPYQQGAYQGGAYQGGTYQQGGAHQGGAYQGGPYQQGAYQGGAYQQGGPHKYKDETGRFEENAKKFFSWLGRLIHGGVVNYFEVWRGGGRVLYFPVILFLFCLIPWVFWVTLALLFIGLLCSCRYRFSGPHLGRDSVNDAVNKAADAAEDVKNSTNDSGGKSGE